MEFDFTAESKFCLCLRMLFDAGVSFYISLVEKGEKIHFQVITEEVSAETEQLLRKRLNRLAKT